MTPGRTVASTLERFQADPDWPVIQQLYDLGLSGWPDDLDETLTLLDDLYLTMHPAHWEYFMLGQEMLKLSTELHETARNSF